tara:strand:- start:4788 stop:7274 length:2487 start_codon:yes stop_codon:yes gene_type:complete
MKDYTNYDYQANLDRMTALLAEAEGWGEGYQSSTGQTLIQMVVDATDYLHYMLERRSSENYIQLARIRSSLVARASDLGYRVTRARGNSGTFRFALPDNGVAVVDIVIPQYTEFTRNGVSYLTAEDATLQVGDNSVDVVAIQGTLESYTAAVDTNGEILIEDYETIDNRGMIVSEGTEEYIDIVTQSDANLRSLSFVDETGQYYDIKYTVLGMAVVFGDDEYGKRPTNDITIQYIRVDGSNDSVLSLDQEFDLQSTLTEELIVTNVTQVRGYSAVESDDSIRKNAPLYHKSGGRAVTNEDYAFWVKNSGIANVVDCKAFGEDELDSLIYNLNNVYITYLKEDGTDLTTQEQVTMRNYLDRIKTSQAHLVFNSARKLLIQTILDFQKNPNAPIADSEAYEIVHKFLVDTFELGDGSIGGTVQSSDLIRDLYRLSITRSNVTYPVIDWAKLELNGVFPFTTPLRTSRVFARLATSYVPQTGDKFVLIFDNLVSEVDVFDGDTTTDIITRMRDQIFLTTPFTARVILNGVALDAFGNPIPVEINPAIGATMLIGVDTPYFSPDQLVEGAAVGSTLARVVLNSPAITVNHYYYSPRAGRRPMIPLRDDTVINFTAPSDTDVLVFTRLEKDTPSTEVQIDTILAGESYTFTAENNEHVLQFEYVNDSYQDEIAEIIYPNFDGTAYGLEITSTDRIGVFSVIETSGDLGDYIDLDYTITLPTFVSVVDPTKDLVLPGSVTIAYTDGVPYLRDRGDGYFENVSGDLIPTGRIDYKTGDVTLPTTIPAGEYMFIYKQNKYDNFTVDANTAMQLIEPKPSINSTVQSISTIEAVNES